MEFKKQELENGLTVLGEVNKAAKSTAVGFFVKTGARDENAGISGVSHYLEHMLFKGTEKLSASQVNEAFDRTGAEFNAFTSEEITVYYAAVLPEYLREVAGTWMELMRPAIRTADFEMEKNVIKEEIAMYKDLPAYDVVDRCRSLHFDGHPCGHSVLGTVESIDALTADAMAGYFGSRYVPQNIVLACAGNFSWDKLVQMAGERCGSWERVPARRQTPTARGSGGSDRVTRAGLVCSHVCLMSDAVSAQDRKRYTAALLASIIGDDTGSRFYWELVDKAIAETATMQFEAMDGAGLVESYIVCKPADEQRILDVVSGIFERIAGEGAQQQELEQARNKILSSLVIKNELPMGRLLDLGVTWIYRNQYQPIAEEVEAIKAVTLDQVNELAAALPLGDYTRVSIGP